MKSRIPPNSSVEELVELFIAIALEQEEASIDFDSRRFNKLYGQMDEVRNRLKAMPGDKRSALVPRLQHPNLEVRLRAAKSTLAVVPEAARATLEALRKITHTPQASDAGMCFRALDQGIFKPT
jgi:hypothetical protein